MTHLSMTEVPKTSSAISPNMTDNSLTGTSLVRPSDSFSPRRFCVAPMLDWTDRHYRYFARLLSKNVMLYSEMITTGALIYGDKDRYLKFTEAEQPVALQLGGSNPAELATCAKMAEDYGYAEVNLNVGCPSDRVQNNMIGACLMGEKNLVADCMAAMSEAVSIPVTIKHRIGIDDLDHYDHMADFVYTVAETGTKTFIVHARKAILQGLSPKENREIPPLNYDAVYQLKKDFPQLEIIINGGIKTFEEIHTHLQHIDGVMLGREAYQNPWLLSEVDEKCFGQPKATFTRFDIVDQLIPYVEKELSEGQSLSYITRHILGLFHGQPGGKQFRRHLSEHAHKSGAGINLLIEATEKVKNQLARQEQRQLEIAAQMRQQQ
jgi:tRNA-dihydrouridine synthase A